MQQEMGVETFEKPVWKDRSPLGPWFLSCEHCGSSQWVSVAASDLLVHLWAPPFQAVIVISAPLQFIPR